MSKAERFRASQSEKDGELERLSVTVMISTGMIMT